MNILFYSSIRRRNLGSFHVHVHEVLSNLLKLGHSVVPISEEAQASGRESDAAQRLSLQSRIRSAMRSLPLYGPLKGEIHLIWLLQGEIRTFVSACLVLLERRQKFDVIYRRHALFNSESLLASLLRVPSVREVNGIIADEASVTGMGDRFSLRVMNLIEGFSMRRADRLIAVTAKLKEVLHEDYGIPQDRIVVVENGANTELFRPMGVDQARRQLGLSGADYFVTFVGMLAAWQGLEYLIESVPHLVQECPRVKVLIVGDGPMKQGLIDLAQRIGVSERVVFTGRVAYQEVPLYINAADICAVPKKPMKTGYSPLKLYECMACSRPVVATRAEGFEILESSNAGFLVEAENPVALADAIIKLLQEPDLRQQMGENGRKYVVENHSWERVAGRVAEVLRQAIEDHNARRGRRALRGPRLQ